MIFYTDYNLNNIVNLDNVKKINTSKGYCGPTWVAQLVKRSPPNATNLGLIPGRGHDPAVGWGDIMFE